MQIASSALRSRLQEMWVFGSVNSRSELPTGVELALGEKDTEPSTPRVSITRCHFTFSVSYFVSAWK